MRDRSKRIYRLLTNQASRESYIRAKMEVLIPSQIKALRLKSEDFSTQADLGRAANMKQSSISRLESFGAANISIESLIRLAAAFRVGLMVKFVSFGEMLEWDNNYSQDEFSVVRLDDDSEFLDPDSKTAAPALTTVSIPQAHKGVLDFDRLTLGAVSTNDFEADEDYKNFDLAFQNEYSGEPNWYGNATGTGPNE